jgi:hypothetical protein
MLRRWLLLATLFFTLGAAAQTAPATLSMSGLGDIHIGMTPAQVEALGHKVEPDDIMYDPEHPEGCWEGRITGVEHVIAMFEDNPLVRLTATSADIAVEGGAHVGMAEAEAKTLFGARLVVEPHHYDDAGHYLKVFSEDRSRALVLETDGATVDLIHAGEAQAAQYVEGCL